MNLTEQIGPNHHPILGCDTLSPIHSSMRPALPSGLTIQIASSIVGPGDSDTQRICDHKIRQLGRNKPWAAVFFGDSAGHVFRVKPNCLLFVLRELLQLLLSFVGGRIQARSFLARHCLCLGGLLLLRLIGSLSLEGSSDGEGTSKTSVVNRRTLLSGIITLLT